MVVKVIVQLTRKVKMCKYCNTEEKIVHSGTDAFVLGCLNDLHKICYKCASEKMLEEE